MLDVPHPMALTIRQKARRSQRPRLVWFLLSIGREIGVDIRLSLGDGFAQGC